MTKSDLGRTVATLACTVVMSAACVLGAIAPADASRAPTSHQPTPHQVVSRTLA